MGSTRPQPVLEDRRRPPVGRRQCALVTPGKAVAAVPQGGIASDARPPARATVAAARSTKGGALRHVVSTGAIAGARVAGVAPVAVGATETPRACDLVRRRAIAATHRLCVATDDVAAVRSAGVT